MCGADRARRPRRRHGQLPLVSDAGYRSRRGPLPVQGGSRAKDRALLPSASTVATPSLAPRGRFPSAPLPVRLSFIVLKSRSSEYNAERAGMLSASYAPPILSQSRVIGPLHSRTDGHQLADRRAAAGTANRRVVVAGNAKECQGRRRKICRSSYSPGDLLFFERRSVFLACGVRGERRSYSDLLHAWPPFATGGD